jgi:hypothetical protein
MTNSIEKRLNNPIDEEFLKANIRIKNALALANIRTYKDLFDKATKQHNLHYIRGIDKVGITKINYHIREKFGKDIPNYHRNLTGNFS